jgi:hypothetical protein
MSLRHVCSGCNTPPLHLTHNTHVSQTKTTSMAIGVTAVIRPTFPAKIVKSLCRALPTRV